MSRPAPLFSVGEEVIVQSKHVESFEAVITSIAWTDSGRSIFTGELYGPGWKYFVTPDINPWPWHEAALRKKHPPSTESFDQIMQGLKRPIGVEA